MDHSSINPPVDDDPHRSLWDIVMTSATDDRAVRVVALRTAVEMRNNVDGPPVDRVLALARRFEAYIRDGSTNTAPYRQ